MPSFKPKATKKIKICKKYTTTLDGKHKEFVNDFVKDEFDTIPKLKEERTNLKQKIDKKTVLTIEQLMEMKDRLKEITETIKNLKDKKNNYFLDNSKFIFEYFENKKNINNVEETNKVVTSKNQLLFNIFKVKQDESENEKNITENKNKNIVQKYLSNIDKSFLDMNSFIRETDICQFCFKGEMIPSFWVD